MNMAADKTKTILVAGSQGVIGRAAALHFAKNEHNHVLGISRRDAAGFDGIQELQVDLLNKADTQIKLKHFGDITHLVFGAYIEKPTAKEKSDVNSALLNNLLDVLEESAPGLRQSPCIREERLMAQILDHLKRRPGKMIPA
jgi:NAD(P)-dependent dehydrogenase (short-subunit alcohol dehydrogenase family)